MTEQPPSWSDLNRAPEPAPKDDRFSEVCALIFSGGPGRELLAMLRAKHFDSRIDPLADQRALLARIVLQQFVRDLETACERGLQAKANRKP
jgi:hypothetical protein